MIAQRQPIKNRASFPSVCAMAITRFRRLAEINLPKPVAFTEFDRERARRKNRRNNRDISRIFPRTKAVNGPVTRPQLASLFLPGALVSSKQIHLAIRSIGFLLSVAHAVHRFGDLISAQFELLKRVADSDCIAAALKQLP